MDLTNVTYAIVEVYNDSVEDVKFAIDQKEAVMKANLMTLDFVSYITEEKIPEEWIENVTYGNLPDESIIINDREVTFATLIGDEMRTSGSCVDASGGYYTTVINIQNQNRQWSEFHSLIIKH